MKVQEFSPSPALEGLNRSFCIRTAGSHYCGNQNQTVINRGTRSLRALIGFATCCNNSRNALQYSPIFKQKTSASLGHLDIERS